MIFDSQKYESPHFTFFLAYLLLACVVYYNIMYIEMFRGSVTFNISFPFSEVVSGKEEGRQPKN